MNDPTPTFAIVGAVNHGKSSVTATLAEDDEVRISSRPGETLECAKFWLDDLFCFWDTPGFQDAREAYEELKTASDADKSPLHVFREFIERHRGQPDFDAECKLLQPIVDGAGIIYVVDGSKQLTCFLIVCLHVFRKLPSPTGISKTIRNLPPSCGRSPRVPTTLKGERLPWPSGPRSS